MNSGALLYHEDFEEEELDYESPLLKNHVFVHLDIEATASQRYRSNNMNLLHKINILAHMDGAMHAPH